MQTTLIATARLNMRPMTQADTADFHALVTRPEVARMLFMFYPEWPFEAAAAFIDEWAWRERLRFRLSITLDGQWIGWIGVSDDPIPEIFYALSSHAAGKGYAAEAVVGFCAFLFERFAIPTLAAGVFTDNPASARVLEKCGFMLVSQELHASRGRKGLSPSFTFHLTRAQFIAAYPVAGQSARLSYRDLHPFDADALHDIVSDWAVVRQLGSFPWPSDPAFTATRAHPYRGDGFAWGVFHAGDLIGTVAVTKGELGYMIAPAQWRQGFAMEACRFALTHAFETLSLDDITAGVWADNDASRGVLAKLGFEVIAETNQMSKARGTMAAGFDLRLTRATWTTPRGA